MKSNKKTKNGFNKFEILTYIVLAKIEFFATGTRVLVLYFH